MDQIKIGRFIAERRKLKNLTQAQLAEKLNITDRAVSKWENGRSLPDSSIMLELCEILEITVNELLSGEADFMKENNNEEILIEMVRQKEEADRQLLFIEIVVGVVCVAIMFALAMVASFAPIEEWLRITLIIVGFLPLVILVPFMIRIEQVAGYYECGKCGHCYIPEYKSVFMSMHMGRTRYMKCPNCKKKSWQKKVLTKNK